MPERHERVVDTERAGREVLAGRAEHAAEDASRVRSTVWSAGRTSITSSSGRSMASAASAIAAAVFRPSGSDEHGVRELVATSRS